jgi:murein L,D-transpeptidase YcbB/YkuD
MRGTGWPRIGACAAGLLLSALLAVPCSALSAQGPDPAEAEAVQELVDRMQAAGRLEVEGVELVSKNALPVLYRENGFRPLWTPERLDALRGLVQDSSKDGLEPEDYHRAELERAASALAGGDPKARARADLLATDAFFLLLYHLYLGKVDPRSLDPQWNFEPRPVGERRGVSFVLEALTKGDLPEAVARVRPGYFWYERARAALAQHRDIAAHGGWPAVPAGRALKPGMKDVRVPALRSRLAATGDLSGQPLDSVVFDEPLAAAVRAFQARHRLEADGAVGPGTLAELNVPVEARILQIRINLERARWVLHEITDEAVVVVDVAGFEVDYLRDRQTKWTARVQIGKPYRQTPIFKSMIDHIVFNPTWTVPPGILARDMLPALRKDPGYLSAKGLDVVDGSGRKVDPSTIDWARQTARTFPYLLRQEPGPENALGRVKIMFPNPYLVYLHDTPSKALFEREERTFSSGCMRVERPLELAALLLNDPERWSAQKIDELVAAGETKTERLSKPVPVLIMYWTIDPTVEGHTVFKRDPYGRDRPLARALEAPFVPGERAAP